MPASKEMIYARYMEAYRKGVYNYIKEEFDAAKQESIPRKYFAGGFTDRAMDFKRTDSKADVAGSVVGENFKVALDIAPQGKKLRQTMLRPFLHFLDGFKGKFKRASLKSTVKALPLALALASQPVTTGMLVKVFGTAAVVVFALGCTTEDEPTPPVESIVDLKQYILKKGFVPFYITYFSSNPTISSIDAVLAAFKEMILVDHTLSSNIVVDYLHAELVLDRVNNTAKDHIRIMLGELVKDQFRSLATVSSYDEMLNIWANSSALRNWSDCWEASKSFVQDGKEDINARKWALTWMVKDIASFKGNEDVFNFFLNILIDTSDLFSSEMRMQAKDGLAIVLTPDLCLKFFNAQPSEVTTKALIASLVELMDFKTLSDASKTATGTLKDQLKTASETAIFSAMRAGHIVKMEQFGPDATPYFIAFAKDVNENTDARKYVLYSLGWVGNYNEVAAYLISVIFDNSYTIYKGWHQTEAGRGFAELVLRQPDIVLADIKRLPDVYKILMDRLRSDFLFQDWGTAVNAKSEAQALGKIGDLPIAMELETIKDLAVRPDVRSAIIQAIADIKARLGLKAPGKVKSTAGTPAVGAAGKNKDLAMTAPSDVGGIDMNKINMNTKGVGSNFEFDLNGVNVSAEDISGFKPVIINITPINSPLAI